MLSPAVIKFDEVVIEPLIPVAAAMLKVEHAAGSAATFKAVLSKDAPPRLLKQFKVGGFESVEAAKAMLWMTSIELLKVREVSGEDPNA